jgi:hypothetical protein
MRREIGSDFVSMKFEEMYSVSFGNLTVGPFGSKQPAHHGHIRRVRMLSFDLPTSRTERQIRMPAGSQVSIAAKELLARIIPSLLWDLYLT